MNKASYLLILIILIAHFTISFAQDSPLAIPIAGGETVTVTVRLISSDSKLSLETAGMSRCAVRQTNIEDNDVGFSRIAGESLSALYQRGKSLGHPYDVYWDNSISPNIDGLNGNVSATIVFGGKLIVAGQFTTIGGVAANHIAAWNNYSWSSLGPGINEPVTALAIFEGKLIAAGSATNVEGVTACRLTAWDGSNWTALGGAGVAGVTNLAISAMLVFDGRLIVGGRFANAGGVPAKNIAAWDGYTWNALGSGLTGGDFPRVYSLLVYDNKLIVGGDFSIAGGLTAGYIASWDGSSWSTLGPGLDGWVVSMASYEGHLIAAGAFLGAGEMPINRIASWDGQYWSALGSGVSSSVVMCLSIYDGKLFAGGRFTSAGSVFANNIAVWDGTSWCPLGSGTNASVYTLTPYKGNLIVGGAFLSAGGKVSAHLAQWSKLRMFVVSLDIKPSSCPNSLYGTEQFRGDAVLPVAILGTYGFNVTNIDPESITLNGVIPTLFSYEDVSTPADKDNDSCACPDYGPDSFCDLVLKFDLNAIRTTLLSNEMVIDATGQLTKIVPSNNSDTRPVDPPGWMSCDSHILFIRGQLNDGRPFGGFDCLTLMNCDTGNTSSPHDSLLEQSIGGNFPNPFNPVTTIEYSISLRSQVTIEVFNMLGQKVRTLVNESKLPGKYSTEWNGTDESGYPVSTGIYFYRFRTGDLVQLRKMLLIK